VSIKQCAADGCNKRKSAKGFCGAHYQRLVRHGDPLGGSHRRYREPKEAFEASTEWDGDCLLWTASTMNGGYGQIWTGKTMYPAHRFAWEQKHGPIPEGLVVDHKYHCSRLCCNPEHLRLATTAQNISNRSGASPHNKTTKIRNVYPHGNNWRVRVRHKTKLVDFGTYSSIEEAEIVAETARRKLFGEYAGQG